MVQLNEIIKLHPIKVGLTIYSKKEFEQLKVDGKTFYSLYLLETEKIYITYEKEKLEFPKISLQQLQKNDARTIVEAEHKLKRLLYEGKNKVSIIKTLSLIMKIHLISLGIIPQTYEEIFCEFAYYYKIKKYSIQKELNKDDLSDSFVQYAKFVVEFLCNEEEKRVSIR